MYYYFQEYLLPIIVSVLFILLNIFKNIKNLSRFGNELNEKLNEEDIFIITNNCCKCYNLTFSNYKICRVKCDLCQIKRVIDFEKERDIYYLLENIGKKVKFLIHTEGGESDFPNFLTYILKQNKIYVETFIPQYAISAGSFIALTSNIIRMNWYSSMGPVDTQVDYNLSNNDSDDECDESYPAKFIKEVKHKSNALTRLKAMESNSYHEDDLFIIRSMFKKKQRQDLIIKHFLNTPLSHSIRYGPKDLSNYGLNIKIGIPNEITYIFKLFKKLNP